MLKLVSVLVILLTIGSGNVWGASVTWEQVAWGDITTSDVIIVTVTTSNGTYLLEHSQGTSATPKLGNTGTLTNSNANCTFDENDNVKWKKDASNRLCKASDGTKWLYTGTSNNTMRVGTSTSGNVWTLDGNYIKSNASTARYLSVYSTTDFRSYTSKQSGQVTRFYKASSATVAAPTFGVAAGTYNNNQSVTLSCATDGATIYYTSSTNGVAPADPTSSSTAYSSAITVNHDNTIIKAIAIKGGTNSTVASATYRLTCATPTFSPTAGEYVGTQSVTISSETSNANIYYTTNGSTPTTSSTLYSGAITVSSSQTIKALVTKSNYTNSAVGSAAYTITPAYTVTWKNQGSTVTTTNVASGSKPVFPDMSLQSGCQTYTYFYGWAEDTWTGEVSSPGTSSTVKVYKSASEMPNVTGDGVVYHAVWGDSPGGWSIVSSIAVDDVVVFAYTNGSSYYKELSGVSNSMGQVSDYSSTPSGLYPLTVCAGTASGYFAFKNGSNYLKGTTSNSLETETSVTDASSWSVSITNGVAEIENKANSGRKLKGNTSQYRIVNYNNNNANNINIWKQSASANCVTSCCNQLAAINGSVSSYTQTSVTLQWDKLSNVDGTTPYTVTCSPAGTVGSIDLSGAKATCTVTGLSCGTAYTFSITAHGTTGYCDKTQSGIAQTTSSYTVGYSVTNGSKTSGDATTCGPLTAVFSANSGYHLPDKAAITVTGASDFSWTKATGTLTITAGQITGNINISFTCPADACTDAFSLHTGTKGGSDWLYNKCFSDADWGAVDDAIWVGEFPSTNECYVGYAGGDSYHGAYWAVGGIKTYNIPNGRTLGWNSSDYYSDYPATALGTFHIYKNSTDENYYLRFKPTSYVLRTGSDGTSWTSRDMTVSGINSNYYESDFVTLTSTLISEHAYVDLKANNGDGHVWCNFSNDRTASGNVKVKNGASTFRATDLQASDNGTYGKFQIDITQDVDNWKLAFVPYFHITYNANGGTGSTAASSYVEVGSTAAAAANGFTAPTGKQFGGWATSADGSKAYDPTDAVTLNSNVELFAVWTDINYTVTVNQNPSVGATTTGQTTTAHYNGTINLTTTVPSGYRFVNWTTSDGFSITNPTSATTASFTMPNKNVTVTANFVQTHTVSWKSNGADYVSPVVYDHGAELALPAGTPSAPGGCSGKVFVGWTAHDEITTETSTKPTIISAGGAVETDATYRAVFADEEDSEVTYTLDWETDPSTADWDISNVTRSNSYAAESHTHSGTYVGEIGSATAYIKLKHKISPTQVSCYYTKATTNTNQSSSFSLGYSEDGSNWLYLGSGLTMNSVTRWTWYDLSWTGDDKEDVYIRFEYNGTNATRLIDDCVITCGGTSYDNYITLCSSCTTPSDLAVSGITSTGGKVTWNGVSVDAPSGFKVLWSTSSSRPEPTTGNNADVAAGTNEYTISGLTPATHYYVWVQSKCNSGWSSSANFYTNAKITYAAGTGATGSMDPKEVSYNTDVVVDACTFEAPTGKTFNGWVSNTAVHVNGGGSTTTAVPAEATINNLTAAITLTAQWRDLAQYHVTFSADNGTVAGGASQTVTEGGTLTFPNVTSTTCGTFSGWVEAAYDNTAAPSGATYHAVGDELAADPSMDGKTYYAVYHVAMGAPTTTTDVLVYSDFNATGSSYVATNNLRKSSAAVYEAVTAQQYSGAFNFNKISDARGIVTPTSGGVFKSITLTTNTNHSVTRKVYVYGSSSYTAAYADPAAFKNNSSVRGTLLATLEGATKTYSTSTDDYEYIAIFADGAAYMDQIDITWYGAPMKYQTSPACTPVVSMTSSLSSFTYVYGNGPSASQSFTVSGTNLSTNPLVVTAPTNYEVCKTSGGDYTTSVSYTPSDGTVTDQTVYIRLAGGLNVGTYNYAAASGVSAASTGATTRTAALTGSVTKAAGAIAFTDFNAVDHYEAEMAAGASSVDVTLTVSVTGDGAVSFSRSPAGGSSAVPATTPTTTLHVTTVGTWTVTANLAAGTNYTNASTNCQVVVYYADRFYDNLHGNSTIVKRNDTGEDHYTIPSLSDETRETSGSCSETHYHFMGWVPESALSTLSNDAAYDAVMITGGGTQAASGTNYYAVWAEE